MPKFPPCAKTEAPTTGKNQAVDWRIIVIYFPGPGSDSTDTSENSTVLVASWRVGTNPEPQQNRASQLIRRMSQFPQGRAILGDPHGNEYLAEAV